MQAGIVTIDLHGKTVYQAKIAIDCALARAKTGTYRLRLIHGYHGGTALKRMIAAQYGCHTRVLRLDVPNPGSTDLVLREF